MKLTTVLTKHIYKTYPNSYVINVISASQAGVPDLIVCINGKSYAMEIKGAGDVLRPSQDSTLLQMQNAGYIVGIVSSKEHIDNLITNEPKYTKKFKERCTL